jgi:hypothetical protein
MSGLPDGLLDPEHLAQCRATDDHAAAAARADQRYCAPYWMFGPRTAAQEAIQHPRAARAARAACPHPSRLGDLQQ